MVSAYEAHRVDTQEKTSDNKKYMFCLDLSFEKDGICIIKREF